MRADDSEQVCADGDPEKGVPGKKPVDRRRSFPPGSGEPSKYGGTGTDGRESILLYPTPESLYTVYARPHGVPEERGSGRIPFRRKGRCGMTKRFLVLLVSFGFLLPAPPVMADADNAAQAIGFVCRVQTQRNVAVVTSLSGMFPLDTPIRFLDEEGNLCATGIVRSAYPDLSYIDLVTGSAECLKQGFVAYSPAAEEEAKILCRYSMNLPLIIGRDGKSGHSLPPNTIVINYIASRMKPVFFHHYLHDFGCKTCHHHDLDTPCTRCHPTGEAKAVAGRKSVSFGDCVREKCIGCHRDYEGASADCVWCQK